MPFPPIRPGRPILGVTRPARVPLPVTPPSPIAPTVHPVSPVEVPVVVPAMPLVGTTSRRARFESLIAEIHQLRGEMNRAVHRCGTILRELATREMLDEAGLPSFEDLLDRYHLPSRVSAMKYMTVAEHFTEEEATMLGVERSYAIIRGAALLPRPVEPRALLAQNPTIHVGPATVQLATAPLRTLLGWVGELEPAGPRAEPGASKRADSLRDKLQRRFVAAGVGRSKMNVRRRGSTYVVRVELTLEEAAALVTAVRKAP